MVSTDGRTDTEGYNIIPRHTLVAGYKKGSEQINDLFPNKIRVAALHSQYRVHSHVRESTFISSTGE